jgi:two-component system, OmpR family, phosphate regulon sensor histidine kinase PhoR
LVKTVLSDYKNNPKSKIEMSLLGSWFGKKVELVEKTSRPILNDILRTMREAVIIVGEDTGIIASNQMAYDAFARKNGGLENKRLSEVIRDRAIHEAFRQALEKGESSEVKFEFLFNERRIFSARIAPLNVENSRHAIGIFYETTQIEHLEKVRQEFLSNVSHELRTPLTSILAFVETLEDGAIDDKENNQRFLGVIRKNAERMHLLIDDIAELSSIESGKTSIEPKEINLSSMIDDIFTNLSAKASDRKIKPQKLVEPTQKVWADKARLEQMLTNLIDNAIKFNREHGSVTVTCKKVDGHYLIGVRDEGEGISSEHLSRIFERFYRTDRARSREIGGTGLGLAIVKHLARLHGGEVSVESTLGQGSIFTIELPQNSPEKLP